MLNVSLSLWKADFDSPSLGLDKHGFCEVDNSITRVDTYFGYVTLGVCLSMSSCFFGHKTLTSSSPHVKKLEIRNKP